MIPSTLLASSRLPVFGTELKFLPAKAQLNCLYTNRVAIGNFDLTINPYYWNSTESAADPSFNEWFQTFDVGSQFTGTKTGALGARCAIFAQTVSRSIRIVQRDAVR